MNIRVDLTDEELRSLRKRLIDERMSLSKFFGECARRYMTQIKKAPRTSRATEEVAAQGA